MWCVVDSDSDSVMVMASSVPSQRPVLSLSCSELVFGSSRSSSRSRSSISTLVVSSSGVRSAGVGGRRGGHGRCLGVSCVGVSS